MITKLHPNVKQCTVVQIAMQSFAILGAHAELALMELHAVTKKNASFNEGQIAFYEHAWSNAPLLMQTLGGTQKLGRITHFLPKQASITDIQTAFLDIFHSLPQQKIHFGISVYGNEAKTQKYSGTLPALSMHIKRTLAAQGISSRVVSNKGVTLSAATITANKLISKGAELVIMPTETHIVLGVTEAVQDIDMWVLHDRGRPRTNAKQGMLPPKLARMMLNLSGMSLNGKTILDPFCGSGTVLMEAGALGAHRLLGSDINNMAIHDTQENLAWAKETFGFHAQNTLITAAAKDVAEKFPKASVDALVTEPYLGRPRRGNETREDIEETISYLAKLYEESFAGLRTLLKPKACIIIASPVHLLGNERFSVPTEKILTSLNYKLYEDRNKNPTYHHEGQFVAREILRFTKE